MTFWLEAENNEGKEARRLKHDLPDPPSGSFSPYALKEWAIREGLEIDYVDNCWLRVAIQRATLIELFVEIYEQEAEFPLAIVASLPREWKFTVVSEEF